MMIIFIFKEEKNSTRHSEQPLGLIIRKKKLLSLINCQHLRRLLYCFLGEKRNGLISNIKKSI